MRKVGSKGFEVAREQGDLLLARWETKGKAMWYELVERHSEVVGTYWDYTSPSASGGFTQSEGYDRRRAMCEIAKQVHNAEVIDKRMMKLVHDCSGVQLPEFSHGAIVRQLESLPGVGAVFLRDSLVAKAGALGVTETALDDKLHEMLGGREASAINNGGLHLQIDYLLSQGVTSTEIEQAFREASDELRSEPAPGM
jgi:hypothetical protein